MAENDKNMIVDPAKMQAGKKFVLTASADVKKTLNDMQTEVDELLHGWKSKGSRSFAAAHQAWTQDATKINNALDDLGEKLGIVGIKHGQADDAVDSAFSVLKG